MDTKATWRDPRRELLGNNQPAAFCTWHDVFSHEDYISTPTEE
jgi:hypothetical protein